MPSSIASASPTGPPPAIRTGTRILPGARRPIRRSCSARRCDTCAVRAARSDSDAPRPARRPSADARARVRVGEPEVLGDAGAAVRLDRPVDHPAGHVRRHDLDHRDLRARRLVAALVHHVARPCSVSSRAWSISMRDSAMRSRVTPCSASGLPERDARLQRAGTSAPARARPARSAACSGGCGPGPGGPARSRSRGPRRAAGWSAGTRTFVEEHLGVPVRRLVVAEHRQHPLHDSTPGMRHRHQDHRLLQVAIGVVRVASCP